MYSIACFACLFFIFFFKCNQIYLLTVLHEIVLLVFRFLINPMCGNLLNVQDEWNIRALLIDGVCCQPVIGIACMEVSHCFADWPHNIALRKTIVLRLISGFIGFDCIHVVNLLTFHEMIIDTVLIWIQVHYMVVVYFLFDIFLCNRIFIVVYES